MTITLFRNNSNRAVVVGGLYAGLSAALELRRLLPEKDTVTVVSTSDTFVFYPSLIWIIQGERELEDISFPMRLVFEEAGIEFIQARLEGINPDEKKISLSSGQTVDFDKLLITTGGEWAWDTLPGLAQA